MHKILIMDDEESIQILYGDELFEEGYEVILSGDGSKLMALIEKENPDIILLDIKLGEYNGLDLLKDTRRIYYDLPVILCTAYTAYKYDIRFSAHDYYLLKSLNLNELKIKIKTVLEGRKQQVISSNYNKIHEIESVPINIKQLSGVKNGRKQTESIRGKIKKNA